MSARNKLKEYIRQLIQKELAEASSTATAGNIHYKTPYAFKKKYGECFKDMTLLECQTIVEEHLENPDKNKGKRKQKYYKKKK